jgi:hypothetical protein
MHILLDEQIDIRMKAALGEFSVVTVQEKGWLGVKNGVLRTYLNQERFQFFITADKNLPFQQNLESAQFIIILLDTPTLLWQHQQLFIPKLINLLYSPPVEPIKLVHVSLADLSKGKKIEPLRSLLSTEQLLFI